MDQVEAVEQVIGEAGAAKGHPGPGDQPAGPGEAPGPGGWQPGRRQPLGRVPGDQELDRPPVHRRLNGEVGRQGAHVPPDPTGDRPQELLGHDPDPGPAQVPMPLLGVGRRLAAGRVRGHRRSPRARW
jgi:hypothetical protein